MKIGVCGKSGSGKSTVSNLLKACLEKSDKNNNEKYTIIDLDLVAKKISNRDSVIKEISNSFGDSYITEKKLLNRKKLGELVFNSKKDLTKLNNIFFKYIKEEIDQNLKKLENVIIEGVILFEIDIASKLDKTIFIHSGKDNDDLLISRIINRESDIDKSTAENRIKIQDKYDSNIDFADIVIENSGNFKTLEDKIIKLFI